MPEAHQILGIDGARVIMSAIYFQQNNVNAFPPITPRDAAHA